MNSLLEGLIDYAGMYPPAQLDPAAAIRQFETHRQRRERPFLGRFVVPAARLSELSGFVEPTPLAVTGHSGAWNDARAFDAEAMNAHLQQAPEDWVIEAYEVRLPADAGAIRPEWIADLINFGAEETYLELPLGDPELLRENLAMLAESEAIFAKARLDPAPSSGDLAMFLQCCLQSELPFKLTAGLHQPFPTNGHFGFLPILGAVAFATQDDLTLQEWEEAISGEGWEFGAEVRWRGRPVHSEAVDEAREWFRSMGSCSVEEPAAALRQLGLWPF